MILTKDQIFAAQDLQSAEVDIPEWGGSVKVRAMSAVDRINFEKDQEGLSPSELVIRIVLMTCIDKDGNRLFSNEDLQHLEKKSPSVLIKIFNKSLKLNILNSDKLEEQAENFIEDHS